ncbi:hypothetical protein [Mesorhizobium sp. BHbdii]
MAWSDLILFAPGILGVGAMVLSKLPNIIDATTGDDQGLFENFVDDARRRRLNYHEMNKEWDVRTVFAQLRREASAAVMADIENWKPILDAKIEEMLKANPQHAKELVGMMGGLSYGHILYEHEARAVDNLFHRRALRQRLSQDARSALRIVG